MTSKVALEKLPTGVPGLDTLLDGGIPRYAFVVITGAPGSGKTTLAHQMMFSLASAEKRALFFTVMGEPPLKMLRYQQQYSFFDVSQIGNSIKYLNLADDLQKSGFDGVLERIMSEVESFQPELIFVDSFKSVVQASKQDAVSRANLQYFVQRLGVHLATWQATTFLLGEYPDVHHEENPIFTVADCVIHLCQDTDANAVVRKMRVVKVRGANHMMGSHSIRITGDGLHVYPRLLESGHPRPVSTQARAASVRLSTGCAELDAMLEGGIPQGHSTLLAGLPGCGKTMLATSFLAAGAAQGESGVIISFEHMLSSSPNAALQALIDSGKIVPLQPAALDMSIEEFVQLLVNEVNRTAAKRVVIDSLNALELMLAPQFRANFLESLFRILSSLHARGVTVFMTRNLADISDPAFGSSSFLVDVILYMQFVEIDNKLIKRLSIPKLRGSPHSNEVRTYTVHANGITIEPH